MASKDSLLKGFCEKQTHDNSDSFFRFESFLSLAFSLAFKESGEFCISKVLGYDMVGCL